MPLVEHHILELDVSVSNALAVQVLQSIDQLPVNPFGLVLAHPAVGLALQKAVRRPTRHILEHKDDLLFRFYGLIQCGNIGMIQSLHQPYLSPDRLLSLDILDLFLFVDFESHLLVQLFVHADSDHSIRTLPNLLANDVVAQTVLV